MEFGPRALCNTTTLANPTEDNVRYINMVNNRNEVMPMAPVILEYNAEILMCENKINRVVGSNKFMIMAHNVKGFFVDGNRGVMHVKPDGLNYTCRPQVINNNSNSNIARILENSGYMCLINTSFNTHGRPILFSVQNAIDDFRKQREKDLENIIYLVILQKND
jgi:carbamoyltransferase